MGAWIEIAYLLPLQSILTVAPLVGAWIEIATEIYKKALSASLPSWERGLKYLVDKCQQHLVVVAPLVGAWIEIVNHCYVASCHKSLPSWERGLK